MHIAAVIFALLLLGEGSKAQKQPGISVETTLFGDVFAHAVFLCDVFATIGCYDRRMMNDTGKLDELAHYQSYLLRLWHEDTAAPWRILATYIPSGEKRLFRKLEDCLAFIKAQTDAPHVRHDDMGVGSEK